METYPALHDRLLKVNKRMTEVFEKLSVVEKSELSDKFLEMARAYFSDSDYFMKKKDELAAFEAVIISWSYVDAGLKAGLFSVPDKLKDYFTA